MVVRDAHIAGWVPQNGERTAVTNDEDTVLVLRSLKGDSSAFDTLFIKYQTYIFNVIYGMLGDREEARDVTQDVFLQAHRSLAKFRGGAKLSTWLYRIAVNKAADFKRSPRSRFLPQIFENLLSEKSPEHLQPERQYVINVEQGIVQSALMLCPLQHREILALRYYSDLSLEEIAQTMQCSAGAAKVRLHRAREVFRERYMVMIEESQSIVHGEEQDVNKIAI